MAAGLTVEQLPWAVTPRRAGETDEAYRQRALTALLLDEFLYLVKADGTDTRLNLDALRGALTPTASLIHTVLTEAAATIRQQFQADWTQTDSEALDFIKNKESEAFQIFHDHSLVGTGTELSELRVENPYPREDEDKLTSIESGATADQTPAEIRDALAALLENDRLSATAIKGLPDGGDPFQLTSIGSADVSTPSAGVWYDTGVAVPSNVDYLTLSFGGLQHWILRSDIADLTPFAAGGEPASEDDYKTYPGAAQDGSDIDLALSTSNTFLIRFREVDFQVDPTTIDERVATWARAHEPTGRAPVDRLDESVVTASQISNFLTQMQINALITGFQTASQVNALINAALAAYATTASLNSAIAPFKNETEINALIAAGVSDYAEATPSGTIAEAQIPSTIARTSQLPPTGLWYTTTLLNSAVGNSNTGIIQVGPVTVAEDEVYRMTFSCILDVDVGDNAVAAGDILVFGRQATGSGLLTGGGNISPGQIGLGFEHPGEDDDDETDESHVPFSYTWIYVVPASKDASSLYFGVSMTDTTDISTAIADGTLVLEQLE